MTDDTIVAISTPPGQGGIGVVRLSGPAAQDILGRLFVSRAGKPRRQWTSHQMTYGFIEAEGRRLDEVLAVVMRSPRSYTAEDVVEIHAHGGPACLQAILTACLTAGARLATPGEFTRRAFLNGRIDLAQAEAVMDVITARTEASLTRAFGQFSGTLSGRVEALRQQVLDWMAALLAQIDFPDDDIPPTPRGVLETRLAAVQGGVEALLATAEEGRIYRDGVRVAIVGKPNVGKSSLLNALLGDERAIVTPIPGTTRDRLEEWASVGGIPVCFVDTAGIRETTDLVESKGIERSKAAVAGADAVLLVVDGSRPWDEEDRLIAGLVQGAKGLVVWNKIDLLEKLSGVEVAWPCVRVSLLGPGTLSELRDRLARMIRDGIGGAGDCVVASARHRDALLRARESLRRIEDTIRQDLPVDFITIDLRAALAALGEVTGQDVTEDILDRIFSQFCLGK
ncbi:MAG TPA: tRNA uridine-5-carboxymethylaminomethyl(34) synthesis GTPase MnmE [Candidatus Xenobia bacterium]